MIPTGEPAARLAAGAQPRGAGSGAARLSAILQGSTIGILGGGQLGRMTAMAARSLGYRVQVMDPDPSCPARFVVDACFVGSWDDAKAAADLARGCDVITLEIEQISLASLDAAARHAPVRPGRDILAMVQDRIRQKNWLRDQGFPSDLTGRSTRKRICCRQSAELGGRIYLKRAHGGYDGRGQVKIEQPNRRRGRCLASPGTTALRGGAGIRSAIRDFGDGGAESQRREFWLTLRRPTIMNSRSWCGARFPPRIPAAGKASPGDRHHHGEPAARWRACSRSRCSSPKGTDSS